VDGDKQISVRPRPLTTRPMKLKRAVINENDDVCMESSAWAQRRVGSRSDHHDL